MNKIVLVEEFATDYPLVTFYTVRSEDDRFSETEKFFQAYSPSHNQGNGLKQDFDAILLTIEEIGQRRGAKERYFRPEGGAEALPPKPQVAQGFLTPEQVETLRLRLYCIRVSESIVILLNGCLKKSQKAQDTPECSAKLRFATNFCRVFNQLWNERSIRQVGNRLQMDDPEIFM